MTDVWERVRAGKHALVVGGAPPEASPDLDALIVRVAGDRPGTLGPLDDAREKVLALLGEESSTWEAAIEEMTAMALRRRVLGEVAVHGVEAEFVAACNRLAAASSAPVAVLFEGLDRCDAATLRALAEILEHESWLQLPLVLHFAGLPDDGPGRELIDQCERRFGGGTVIEAAQTTAAPETGTTFDVNRLPSDILPYLRVASIMGGSFEAELVARVLEVATGQVLEGLQRAADLGTPFADRGDGTFSLPAEVVRAIEHRMLPSLRAHWHRRLAELLTRSDLERAGAEAVVTAPTARAANTPPPEEAEAEPEPVPEGEYGDFFERSGTIETSPDDEVRRDVPPLPNRRERIRRDAELERGAAGGDQARAARHLLAAGEREAAVQRYLAAIRQLTRRGNARRALLLVEEALDLVEPIRTSPAGALLRARLLTAGGSIRWQGAGLGAEYTLGRALEVLEEAQRSLPDNAPAQDRAAVASAIAGVCYDLGDVRSLERSLGELTNAARVLRSAGDAIGAARLLNDQAAVYLRAGDPVRATHLLNGSREVFERLRQEDADDPVVIEELAETEHLLARLPLRAKLRAGREADAYSLALGHARAAESAYRQLGKARPLARVWESIGRLELRRGRLEHAARRLDAAAELQRKAGDVVGLARTAAAMSDVYAAADRPVDALALLGESITLNTDKGSPLGLAYNRKAVEILRGAIGRAGPDEKNAMAPALREIETRLGESESVLGKIVVPGDD